MIESYRRHFNTARPHALWDTSHPTETVLLRGGTIALWPGAPALENAPPANPVVAKKPLLH